MPACSPLASSVPLAPASAQAAGFCGGAPRATLDLPPLPPPAERPRVKI
jgi:hypothetical protein